MSAVWLCKDDATGVLLAGITANYNAITDKFYNLATFETKTGQNYQSARYTIDKDLIPVTEPVTEISETTVENSEGSKDKKKNLFLFFLWGYFCLSVLLFL